MESLRMPFDDVAWEAGEKMETDWVKKVHELETLRAIGKFIALHREGIATELCNPVAGSFNLSICMKFQDGGSAIIRFPKPGASMFPDEKVRNEVAVIRYLQDHTTIPVPFILHWGTKEQSPLCLGPFIIMEYINHEMDLGAALNSPHLSREDRPRLDPNIEMETLRKLYRQLADILLQLSTLTFPFVGSLAQSDESTWEIKNRPLTIGMNELVRLGTLSRRRLPMTTFKSSTSYFEALAKLHVDHLDDQRNDAVNSKTDCEEKYIARQLFQKLAREGKLASITHDSGPFRLWCDDFRPSNVLLNERLEIVGVVDWEFTYAAPSDFSFAPPWWLLLEQPEYWEQGLEDWIQTFESRLQIFLDVLVEEEDAAIQKKRLNEDQRLSREMRGIWDRGDFWLSYAARKNFAFDAVFWKFLRPRFFDNDVRKLLDQEARDNMDLLVNRKMNNITVRELAWEPDE